MKYEEVVSRLEDRTSCPGDFGFDAFQDAVRERGHPQQGYDVIHVAGTNGKGSCCHILSGILQQAGDSVGLFTGPHLGSPRDRIQVDGTPVSEDAFAALFKEVQDTDFSRFECLVVMALTYFARQDVDTAVVETGLGGRRDATNIVDPAVTVITNVSKEHTDVLGETIPKIASEKAGIIKPKTPLVTGAGLPALDVINEAAIDHRTDIYLPDSYVSVTGTSPLELSFPGQHVTPGIRGKYQVDNINICIETVQHLDRDIPDADVVDALQAVQIPGRMEQVQDDPAVILDGAHNPDGIDALVRSITDVDTVVFGCMDTKPYPAMLTGLADVADQFIYTHPGKANAVDPAQFTAIQPGDIVMDPVTAVQEAIQDSDDTVLVTGSMYLLRQVRPTLLADQRPVCTT